MFIAISQRNDKNKYGVLVDSLENTYFNYLNKFKINLIPIPNNPNSINSYFKLPIERIILSGGNDIESSKKRDETETKLLDFAVQNKIPVLGICRGMQYINIFFGGSLSYISNHVATNHKVKIENSYFNVNSYHNMGVKEKDLALRLKAFAKTNEGIIEGIYHPFLPIAGIQWHPERNSPNKDINEKLINAFLNKNLFWKHD